MSTSSTHATDLSPIVSIRPVVLPAPGRGDDLQVRATAPSTGSDLPVVVFSHGFGFSMDAYGPLVEHWAAAGFVVVQPTHLDSLSLGLAPDDPRTPQVWRRRIEDLTNILDHLDVIEASVPGLAGRLDRNRIAATGHSYGATTASALLGARTLGPVGDPDEDFTDSRVTAGVLLCVPGEAGDALTPLATQFFPFMYPGFEAMSAPALMVAGDEDQSPLSTRGPDWFTDAYRLSPQGKELLTIHGAQHGLGGIQKPLGIPESASGQPGLGRHRPARHVGVPASRAPERRPRLEAGQERAGAGHRAGSHGGQVSRSGPHGPVSFGIATAPQQVAYRDLLRVWHEADALPQLEHAWVFDHLLPIGGDPNGPVFEGWTLLAALAAHTQRLRLGVLVTSNRIRPPAVLAKIAATVDVISDGRLDFGIGVGSRPNPPEAWREYPAHGLAFDPFPEAVAKLDEACTVIRRLWTEPEPFDFHGDHLQLVGAHCEPKPPQHPHPPIVIGGRTTATLRVAARHADIWNVPGGDLDDCIERSALLDDRCREIARDPRQPHALHPSARRLREPQRDPRCHVPRRTRRVLPHGAEPPRPLARRRGDVGR